MPLLTGNVIHRYSWTEMNAGADIVHRVKELAIEQGQNLIGKILNIHTTKMQSTMRLVTYF